MSTYTTSISVIRISNCSITTAAAA
eukprot:COSAG06_NODE_85142_length_100_cov_120.000000_1_plen_24_part_10